MLGVAALGFTAFAIIVNHLPIFEAAPERPGPQAEVHPVLTSNPLPTHP